MGLVSNLTGQRIYLDTNVFIYALNGFPAYTTLLAELLDAVESGDVSAVTSELALAELLIIPFRHGNVEEENRCRMILRPRPHLSLLPVDMDVLEATARLRAALPTMRTPDAIHAATAQLARCDAFLTNDRRLKAIPGLRIQLLSEAVTLRGA
jgi:predicted nucleic acid-binding protein